MAESKGIVHSLESFGSVDGPGVRFVVFMQGCNMRCKYCHNPETWRHEGKAYTPRELFSQAWKYRTYWGKDLSRGGVTVSGGEPLLQIEFVTDFFKILKEHGVHTAIDTSGQPFSQDREFLEKFDELLKYTDLIILDLKESDSERHKSLTGFDNGNIWQLARYLSDKKVPMWIRHVLVPTLTDGEEHLRALRSFIDTLDTVEKVEVLPYHTLGIMKWNSLGLKYPLDGIRPPGAQELQRAKNILE